ncbi:MAG TPA: BlaI/MecI/CopY family transcriptional regulator [candidate division Zixibacteria bacterium]|nr:BlaI/MecI/CopY family transcriptional regulator [candidate division Zixibacteria bacterium]
MKKQNLKRLSRREGQIMDILYRSGEAKAAEVHAALPDPPSYSSVRALLVVLEEKGLVKHRRDGRAYFYSPTISHTAASRSALMHLVKTFFEDSVEQVVATLLSMSGGKMSDEEYRKLRRLLDSARERGEKK